MRIKNYTDRLFYILCLVEILDILVRMKVTILHRESINFVENVGVNNLSIICNSL